MPNYTMDCITGSRVLAGNAATLAHTIRLIVSPGAYGLTGVQVNFKSCGYLTDTVGFRLSDQTVGLVATLTSSVGFSGGAGDWTYAYNPGALIEDTVVFVDDINPLLKFTDVLTDGLRIRDILSAGRPIYLVDAVGFNDALVAQRAAMLADSLILGDQLSEQMTYYVALLDRAGFRDALTYFLAASLNDVFFLGDTVTGVYRPHAALGDTIFFQDDIAPKLLLRIDLTDGVKFDDTLALRMIFDGQLHDDVQFSIAFISPGGDFTAWALNVSDNQISEYTNWVFNSFARAGAKYLGANDDGIFELRGATDDGDNIVAAVKSGLLALNGPQLAGVAAAYIGLRGSGDYILKIETGDGREYIYAIQADKSMLTTKVNLGKGLRANLFSFELISTGPDFDLSSIEFIPLRAARRV